MNEICRMLLKFSNIFLYFKNSQENRVSYYSNLKALTVDNIGKFRISAIIRIDIDFDNAANGRVSLRDVFRLPRWIRATEEHRSVSRGESLIHRREHNLGYCELEGNEL